MVDEGKLANNVVDHEKVTIIWMLWIFNKKEREGMKHNITNTSFGNHNHTIGPNET